MPETVEVTPATHLQPLTNKTATPASPLWHFIRENCKACPLITSCSKCDYEQQLKCILARIALDLHTLTRNNTIRDKRPTW